MILLPREVYLYCIFVERKNIVSNSLVNTHLGIKNELLRSLNVTLQLGHFTSADPGHATHPLRFL